MAREVPLHVKSNVWKTLARRTVLSRLPWYEIEEERVELPDGRVIDAYTAMRLRDYVVVALTHGHDVLLAKPCARRTHLIRSQLINGLTDHGG
jgi:hypothetical protein